MTSTQVDTLPERLVDGMPADIEPGYTLHRLQEDINFLAFVMPDDFEAEVDLCIWRAKHRRTPKWPLLTT